MRLSRILRGTFLISLFIGIGLSVFSGMFYFAVMPSWGFLIGPLFVIALFSAVALACALTIERGRLEKLLWSGIATAVIAATGWNFGIWLDAFLSSSDRELCVYILAPITSWSLLCAITAVLLRNRITNLAARITCSITIISFALLAVLVVIVVSRTVAASHINNDAFVKPILYTTVIAVTNLLLTVILSNIKQIQGVTEVEVIKIEMDVSCPRCKLKQIIMTGGASCNRCGLRIKVSIP